MSTWFPSRQWDITGYTTDDPPKPLWGSSDNVDEHRRELLRRILERDYANAAERDGLKQALADWDAAVTA